MGRKKQGTASKTEQNEEEDRRVTGLSTPIVQLKCTDK
jgi:hypothetical protein